LFTGNARVVRRQKASRTLVQSDIQFGFLPHCGVRDVGHSTESARIFARAAPFALIMLAVAALVVAVPAMTTEF
jgi:hypothetical protein